MLFGLLALLPIAGAVLTPWTQFSIPLQNETVLCGQYQSFNTSSGLYTLETNQWGYDGSGSQCILVGNTVVNSTQVNNQGNYTNSTAFAATWGWNDNPGLVHAYPNARYVSNLLPLKLQNLSSLTIDVQWAYNSASDTSGSNNFAALNSLQTSANVAVDMFLDSNPTKAVTTTNASYEIMVWFANFGTVLPIGASNNSQSQKQIGQSTFNLYIGPNGNGQKVFSWVCLSNTTSFTGDLGPLIRNVAFHGGPNTTDYLGVYQFGTETFHTNSAQNVTFTAQSLTMNVVQGIAPIDSAASHVRLGSSLIIVLAVMIFQMMI